MPTTSEVSVPRVDLAHLCRPWPATGVPTLRAGAERLVPNRPAFVQIEVSSDVMFGVTVIPGAIQPDGTQNLVAYEDDDRALVAIAARLIHADADLRRGVRPLGTRCLSPSIIAFPSREVARVS